MPSASAKPLRRYLRQQEKKFSALAKEAHRPGSGPEAVHKLRVSTRRIRALLWILAHEPGRPHLKRAAKRFRRLGKALGERRELDVIEESAAHFAVDAAPLEQEKKAAAKLVRRETKAKQRKSLARELRRLKLELKAHPRVKLGAILTALETKVSYWKSKPIGPGDYHRFRIDMKKVRYLLEALALDTGDFSELQEDLGRAHDLDILQSKLGPDPRVEAERRAAFSRAKRRQAKILGFAEARLSELAA